MWRRHKWQTLVALVGCVVLTGHLVGKLAPDITTSCPKETVLVQRDGDTKPIFGIPGNLLVPLVEPQRSDRNHSSMSLSAGQGLDILATRDRDSREVDETLKWQGAVKARKTWPGGIPTGGDPKVFQLVSEMNSTIHTWPWPDSKELVERCKYKNWYALGDLPDATVIISFHDNEDVFNIIHTLHAVVKRTPHKLLKEIILIDDNTRKDQFLQILDMHIKTYFGDLVRLVRSSVDLGLIRGRLNGIRAARGKAVVVMDSHVEPQPGWLEALLYEIVKDRRTLASPFLDWMQKADRIWNYRHGASTWITYFDWTLTFGFQVLSDERIAARKDPTEALRSPVTVGTVWAMDKEWFEEVGAFDEGMFRWGGENLDLAVRVWLFGGRVVNVPCSHVSHLEKDGSRDYRNSWSDIIHTNYKRFVEVWLDDYKKYFYMHLPQVQSLDAGDLYSRRAIKAKAKHNFTWFLQNVFPELGIPDSNVFAYGGLQTLKSYALRGRCFDSLYSMTPGLAECHPSHISTQGVFWTKTGLLRLPINVVTTEMYKQMGSIRVFEYTSYFNTSRANTWFHVKDGPLIDTQSGLCVEVGEDSELIMAKCLETAAQYWRFRVYSQDYNQLEESGKNALPVFTPYLKLFKTQKYRVTASHQNFQFDFGARPRK